jgi:hypothetical protein
MPVDGKLLIIMRDKKLLRILILLCIGASSSIAAIGQNYTGLPVTKDRLVRTVKAKQFSVVQIVKQIKKNGVNFELTRAVEGELTSAGAHAQIIDAVRTNYRYKGAAGRTPPKPEIDVNGENYEIALGKALGALTQLGSATSIQQANTYSKNTADLANQAIAIDPARPEAYTVMGASLMLMRNFTEAERYGQMAIDRGGELRFPVYHLAGQPHLETLFVGTGYVTVESPAKNFQYFGSEIRSVRSEQNYFTGNGYVAAFSITMNKPGQPDLWYFSPAMTSTPEEAQLIMNLIRKNSTK